MALKSFIGQTGQSVSDLALMAYGDSSKIFDLKKENPDIDLNKSNYAGVQIFYTAPTNNVNFIKLGLTNIVFATASIQENNSDYLLQEDGSDFILEDNSGKIELEN